MHSYRTLASCVAHEIPKIKGSRFIASVALAATEEQARAHVVAVRKLHHAARHVCSAWVLGPDGSVSRFSDDGEPSGSAGRPILAAITGRELTFTAVAVIRYYGGKKLGVGGLVRAYGGAAAEALDLAGVEVVVPMSHLEVQIDYGQLKILEAFGAIEGLAAADSDYGERVRLTYEIPASQVQGVAERLFDYSGGRVRPVVLTE
jgi:uncharacterized YigZ family protein